ncbi:hypothetical protein [Pseudomonas phage vB_PaeM_RP7]|nr:MAG: hypothetical protein [Pseudomonas phage RP4]WAB56750.1 hypothetical protein [Pseudomonas phage vB_PaeM_RP15]WAB57036.1 hypothetical protein [Pseudomonas phage vB_PaeM_RP6]WAB57055.1 hypothetical protein [Pseudomonas phage vB_PaeM_RP7]WAB57364.1 hypothetical protein [Pseudomonas phage vB_PaeM_RP8]WAB57546.1 hypothetical protein [Pseudomonas phage vB_PaeM_RP9]WAB57663.1 hypothetical protein [Pseudomonas phage vB_PaeM_RP10]WAB57779.1 hypothetical protein [Pseudomonas phage vB_PaeM_RP11]
MWCRGLPAPLGVPGAVWREGLKVHHTNPLRPGGCRGRSSRL